MAQSKLSKKNPALFLLYGLSILSTCLGAVVAQASTYYVATTGDDANSGSDFQPFKTIRKGLSVVRAGDTLYIRNGTYAEQINSNSQTIPTGSSWEDAPTISAYSGEMVILQPPAGAEVVNLSHPYIKYVIFSNLVLDASRLQRTCAGGYGCSYGIGITNGANHVRFRNVEVKNAAGSGVLMTRGGSNSPTSFEFIGCDVHHNGTESRDHGFYLATSGNRIRNGKVHHNTGHGIHVYTGSSSVTADNNIIDGNDIYGNAIMSGSAPGILFDNGSGNAAYNNIVRANKNGIHVGNPYTSIATVTGTKIYNNTVYSNLPGVGINVFQSSSQTEVKNNLVYKNGGTILSTGTNVANTNNLFADPRFIDEANANFKLQQTSPAINQGVPLAEVTIDLAGVSRPQLGAHDVGAYEYSSTGGDTTPPLTPKNVRLQ